VVHFNHVGTCTVTYDDAGNSDYSAATQVTENITVGQATQGTVTVTAQASKPWSSTFTVSATGGNGSGGYVFTLDGSSSSVCHLSGTTLSATGSGTCYVSAIKSGDANWLVSTASALQSFVFTATAQTPITLTSTSGIYGVGLTMTFTGGSGTGLVSYGVANGTATGCSITSGVLSSTSAGTCIVTVNKASDTNYLAASSAPATVTLSPSAKAPSTTTMSQSRSTVTYGNEGAQTFTAIVSGLTSNTQPTGTMTFKFGAQTLCSTPTFYWVNAHAVSFSCSLSSVELPAGSYTVVAVYSGDSHYAGSTSSPALSFTVAKDSSKTVVSESATHALYGSEGGVIFKAKVTAFYGESVAGDPVTIHIGSATCSGVTNGSGVFSCSIANSALPAGSYPVSATYAGDTNVAGSSSTNSTTFAVWVAPVFTSANNASAVVGHFFSFHVSATGYPAVSYSISGAMPSGVSFNSSTGVLSGTPANGTAGTWTFTITATNSAGSTSQTFKLKITAH
jgi:hypothetical protein